MFDYAMYGLAIVTPLALLPQVFQVFIDRNVAGLSVLTWSLLGVVNFLWSLYGFIHKQFPVFIANLLIGILDFIIVVGILLYR